MSKVRPGVLPSVDSSFMMHLPNYSVSSLTMSSLRFLRACYHTGAGNTVRKPTIASVKTHTMGQSLSEYLRMKVHPFIHTNHWSRIVVKGEHQRDPSVVRHREERQTMQLAAPHSLCDWLQDASSALLSWY